MIIKSTIKTKHKIHSKGEKTQTGEKNSEKKGIGFTLIF